MPLLGHCTGSSLLGLSGTMRILAPWQLTQPATAAGAPPGPRSGAAARSGP